MIVDQNTEIVRIGLVELNNSALANDYYDYGFELYSNGTFRRIENGSLAGTAKPYSAGDIFRIERKEESNDTYSKVEFHHGNTLEYTTATFLTKTGKALIGKVSFNGTPGSVSNLNLFGPLIDKKLQTIDYDYNIRGWLTDINDIDYVPPTLGLGSVNSYNDLFNFRINYNGAIEGASDVEPLYNGNISQTIWKSAYVDPDNKKRTYGYKYDYINRITRAQSYSGPTLTDIDSYSVWGITYDSNGNIKTLNRKGEDDNSFTDHWDELTYEYTGNRLDKVVENLSINSPQRDLGFKDGTNSGDDYGYDVNGNMTSDENKNISSISYNHLNLPVTINVTSTVNSSGGHINYVYDATGVKHAKIFTSAGVNPQTVTTEYAGNYIYNQSGTGDNILQFFSHPEGYVEPTPVIPSGGGDSKSVKGFNASTGQVTYSTYQYVFQYKDHLGNIRLSYADEDRNGSIDASSEIIEESNYYPFGLKQWGYNDVTNGGNDLAQQWKFGGKEYNQELGLSTYDFGARNYMPDVGRWGNIDALADAAGQIHNSPYVYGMNNPISYNDPDGNCPPGVDCTQVLVAAAQWLLFNDTGSGKKVLTGGLHVIKPSLAERNPNPAAFAENVGVSLYNSAASTWNSAMNGDDYGMMIGEGMEEMGNMADRVIAGEATVQDGENFVAGGIMAAVTVRAGTAGSGRAKVKAGNYTNLKEPRNVGAGKKFTKAQKARILEENRKSNGGVLKSDLSGQKLVDPVQSKKGVPALMNQAEIDHVSSRSKGGSNSNSNAQVLSKKENIKKSNN